ncbi:MAG: restriction endonuclease subunit S, partial [Bacteroides sp.]
KISDGEPIFIEDELPFELPEGWCWARLASLYLINPRNDTADDTATSFIPMANIESGYTGVVRPEVRLWKQIKKGFTHFADGDIVFSKISPCFENGKYFIASNLVNGIGAGTTELFVLRPTGVCLESQYVYAYLRSKTFAKGGTETFMGTVGQQRVKRGYVEQAFLPVPPRNEQRRIANTVDFWLYALDFQ